MAVYVLIDPLTEEIRYVGWTRHPLTERLRGHLRERKSSHRVHWLQSLRQQGLRPRIQLVQEVPEGQWVEAERYWIAFFKSSGCPLVNGTDGGEGMQGHKTSVETREKLRVATLKQFESPAMREAVGRVHRGKTISEGHKQKISAANKRRWAEWRASGGVTSEETKAKIRAARMGVSLSEEHKARIRGTTKGKPKSAEHRAKIAEARKKRET